MQRAEDLRVRMEADQRAAAVLHRAGLLELGHRLAARIGLPPEHAVARDLDLEPVGQRVDHRAADAVQAARGRIGLAAELAAGVQRGEDDLQRAEVLELGMRIDRDAAAVVAHAEPVAGLERHLDGGWRGRRRPRPSRCRAPRRRGGAARPRRCRRYTCRGGAGRARGLPAPRCPGRSSPASPPAPPSEVNRSFMLCSRSCPGP